MIELVMHRTYFVCNVHGKSYSVIASQGSNREQCKKVDDELNIVKIRN